MLVGIHIRLRLCLRLHIPCWPSLLLLAFDAALRRRLRQRRAIHSHGLRSAARRGRAAYAAPSVRCRFMHCLSQPSQGVWRRRRWHATRPHDRRGLLCCQACPHRGSAGGQ